MSIDLSERMSKLKEENNISSTSDDKTPTPLWVFLYICEKSDRAYYTEYMAGAKALAKYLAPIEIHPMPQKSPPDMLRSYETQELARIISPASKAPEDFKRYYEVYAIILHTLMDMHYEREII